MSDIQMKWIQRKRKTQRHENSQFIGKNRREKRAQMQWFLVQVFLYAIDESDKSFDQLFCRNKMKSERNAQKNEEKYFHVEQMTRFAG